MDPSSPEVQQNPGSRLAVELRAPRSSNVAPGVAQVGVGDRCAWEITLDDDDDDEDDHHLYVCISVV